MKQTNRFFPLLSAGVRAAAKAQAKSSTHTGKAQAKRSPAKGQAKSSTHTGKIQAKRLPAKAQAKSSTHTGKAQPKSSPAKAQLKSSTHIGKAQAKRSPAKAQLKSSTHTGKAQAKRSPAKAQLKSSPAKGQSKIQRRDRIRRPTGVGAAAFGAFVRRERMAKGIGLRAMARMVGISPTYLSKVERDGFPPPAEDKVKTIAAIIGCDADELLALAGRVASDLLEIIRERPRIFAPLLRELEGLPPETIADMARRMRKLAAQHKGRSLCAENPGDAGRTDVAVAGRR